MLGLTCSRARTIHRSSSSGVPCQVPMRAKSMNAPGLQERGIGLDPEHELTHRLEVRLAPLELLGHRVDVAEPAIEGAVDEDRGRAGGVMRDVGDRLRLVN